MNAEQEKELCALVTLSMIPKIGPATIRKLISYAGSAYKSLYLKKKDLLEIPSVGTFTADKILNQQQLKVAEDEIAFCNKNNIEIFSFLDKEYPERLKNCEDAPLFLFVKGQLSSESNKFISIVGTRKPSPFGVEFTRDFIRELKNICSDIVVVSGLAYGIDITAHKYCIENDIPNYAILGHGLNQIYPETHANYAREITKNGAVISDFTRVENFERGNFPRRNRIIAGITDATMVVESDIKGGALVTADIAFSYNRDLFACPGHPGERYSRGTNELIKSNKAMLVDSASDVVKQMSWDINLEAHRQNKLFFYPSESELEIIKVLNGFSEISIDYICRILKKPVSVISPSLLKLEFEGIIEALPGRFYRLNKFVEVEGV